MQEHRWMRNKSGGQIMVSDSQVKAFEAQGYKLFEKPVLPQKPRGRGHQMNLGPSVHMRKDKDTILASLSQVETLKAAGWKVMKKQPEAPASPAPAPAGRAPMRGSVRLTHPAGGECFASEAQVAALKMAGWVSPGSVEEAPRGQSEMQLSVPALIVEGKPFAAHIDQQIQPGQGLQAAGVQFAAEAEGPWTTAQPDSGSIQAGPIQFSEQDTAWDYPGIVAIEDAWMRVGAWPDQSLSGDPVVHSNSEEIKPKSKATEKSSFE